MTSPRVLALIDAAVDAVPGDIMLGIPLAIGKPNPLINALYRRIEANPSRPRSILMLRAIRDNKDGLRSSTV